MTRKENEVPGIATRDELLIGELTAALAAESMSAQDALPPPFAARAIAARAGSARAGSAGEVIVKHESMAPASRARRSFAVWGGWLAAAAMLALWVRGPVSLPAVDAAAPTASTASAAASWVRDSLIAGDSAITRIAWAPTANSTALGASGDVVWSTRDGGIRADQRPCAGGRRRDVRGHRRSSGRRGGEHTRTGGAAGGAVARSPLACVRGSEWTDGLLVRAKGAKGREATRRTTKEK